MKRPALVATLVACARHHRQEIASLEAIGKASRTSAQREKLRQHQAELRKVEVQAFRASINIGGPGDVRSPCSAAR